MVVDRKKRAAHRWLESEHFLPSVLFMGVALIFLVLIYPTLLAPKIAYKPGDVVETDIKAPRDFFVEDTEATESRRQQAVSDVPTVYDHDLSMAMNSVKSVQEAFDLCRIVYEESDGEVLWIDPSGGNETDLTGLVPENELVHEQIAKRKASFEGKLGISVSEGAYSILEEERFSADIENLIVRILTEILNNGVVANKELLLKESDKGIALRNINNGAERTILNLKPFYGMDQAKTMVRVVGQPMLKDLNYTLRNLVVDFVQQLIQPNITLNRSETERRKKEAAAQIKPILYVIKAGEMLLREGERVTQVQRLKLEALHSQFKEEKRLAGGLGAALIVFCLLMSTHILYLNRQSEFKRNHARTCCSWPAWSWCFFS